MEGLKPMYEGDGEVRLQCGNNYLCTCDLYSPVHNVLDGCVYITWGSGRGLGPGIPKFLGPVKWERADRRVPLRAQKTREFQGPTPSHFPK